MLARVRSHLTYANVMATVAVFIALGGASYAAFSLPNDSVKSKHIKNGQVKTGDIRQDAIKGPKVADGSLALSDSARSEESNLSGSTVSARSCDEANFGFSSLNLQDGDIGFLVPTGGDGVPGGIVFGRPAFASGDSNFLTGVCNITNADIVLPTPFPVRVYAFSP